MKFHDEVLSANQQRALRELGSVMDDLRFSLGGGTAVAIHLGHRESLDLDWFTEARIENPFGLAEEIRGRGTEMRVVSVQRGTLHGEVHGVRVSFIREPWVRRRGRSAAGGSKRQK